METDHQLIFVSCSLRRQVGTFIRSGALYPEKPDLPFLKQ